MDQRSRSAFPRRMPQRLRTWGLVQLAFAGGFFGARFLRAPGMTTLVPALDADLAALDLPFGRLAYYAGGASEGPPLLLVHSVNAAASSYEMKPLFDRYAQKRPVYVIDLPGFGFSDRPDRIYTPRLMTDAILAMVEAIREVHGAFPIDVVALSLSAEFLARAATEHPTLFRTLGFISPTGFESRLDRDGPAGETFGKAGVRDLVSFPAWGRALFELLVSRPSIRFFLEKTWGRKRIDEGLFEYCYATAHQKGAEHAPFSFLAGFLFSKDALALYRELPQPVWMTHGVRGDFVDFVRKRDVEDRPNWTIVVFDTGAMSHFEYPDRIVTSYDAFLAKAA